jgi:hypothetical protein
MVVADDEADAAQAALDERADEARPGRALVVAGGELEAKHPPLAGRRHAGDRHRHDPPGLADLDVRGVEPDIRMGDLAERAGPERRDLGVERRAHPADLAPTDAVYAERPHEVVDPAGADPAEVGLLDDRQEGPLGPPVRLEERREVAAVTDPRDRQLDRADAGVPAPVAIAVAVGQPTLRVALALGRSGELGHLGLHHGLRQQPDTLPQEIGVTVGDRLAHRLERGHPVLGHCVFLRVVGSYSNDATMTRWPLPFTANPLLHHLTEHDPAGRAQRLRAMRVWRARV